MRQLIVNDPLYHKTPVKPQNFAEWCDMFDTQGKITGLWSLKQVDGITGRVIKELWNKNVITDQGAINILERAINSAAATLPGLFNNLLITNNSGSTTLTTALTSGQTAITSLAVAALPAAIPLGTNLQIGFGSGQTQTVTTSAAAVQGATSITVTSFTSNAAYGVGTAVVPLPTVADNPTNANLTANATTPLTSYSGNLPTTAFTFNPTTGAGNRNVVATYTFTAAGGTAVGNYTDAWLVNVATGATTNDYVAHEINTPMRCDTTPNNIVATVTVKL